MNCRPLNPMAAEFNPNANYDGLKEYFEKKGIVEVEPGRYRVVTWIKSIKSKDMLCALSMEMVREFDVKPTDVDCKDGKFYFTNQFGLFFI